MKIENVSIVTLDKTDVSKASVNGGLSVPLPPQTTEVVIRVEKQEQ